MHTILSWFKGIKGRLFLSAIIPVVGFIITGIITFNGLGKITKLLHSAHNFIIPNIQTLTAMENQGNRFGFNIMNSISGQRLGTPNDDELQNAKEAIAAFKNQLELYKSTPFMPEEEIKFKSTEETFSKLIAAMEKIHQLAATKDPEKMAQAELQVHQEIDLYGSKVADYLAEIVVLYNNLAKADSQSANETDKFVTLLTLIVMSVSCLISLILSFWFALQISNLLSKIGDKLEVASSSVSSSVEQLSEAGSSLSQSSTEAAASLEETVAALEEMSSMVQMNSDNAKQAAALSSTSRDAAEKGEHEIESLIQAMTEIAKSSKKIEEIISVIDDIAFQTNLLALNASVEAARAGEQGKGFAVVADAVRALAQRSADAAKDINSLIKDSVAKVDQGGRIAGQSGEVLHNIVTSVKKVSDLNTEIATASAEQTAGIQQISKAMNQLDQSSQSNAASAEEIAATSSEIRSLANTSQHLTMELSAVIHGGHHLTQNKTSPHKVTTFKENNVVPLNKAAKTVTTTPVATPTPSLKKSAPAKSQVHSIIPFDEDETDSRSKVGTTDGF